jgi:hypothetical protein
MNRQQRSTISIEHDGRRFSAIRVVEGTRTLSQYLIANDRKEPDSGRYKPGREAEMESMANLILWQLATRGSLGQPPLEPDE